MKISVKQGATSVTINIFIADSSSTTGAGLTGLAFNTAGLTAYYARPKIAAVAITLATLAAVTSAFSSGGFKEIDATNMPGWYRLDIPDAAIANAERFVSIHLKGATNMAPLPIEIALESWDNQTAISPTGDTFTRAGAPAGASLAADIASIKTDTGTTIPGRLPAALAADGSIKASLQSILGTAFTEGAAGRIAAGFKQFFNIASPASTMDQIILVNTTTTLTNAPSDSAGVTTLLGKLAGITLLRHWLGAIAGKQAADATAQTEIRNSGAGSGTYDPTTDSLEANRDNLGTNGAALALAKTTNITGFNDISAATVTGAVPTAIQNADALLDRDMSVGTDSGSPTVRTPRQALRANRNKVSIAAGTLTVTKEDDSTASWTAAVTTTAGNPISTIDPA